MRLLLQFIIFLLTLPFSPLFDVYDYKVEPEEGPEHYSWDLGEPDNKPQFEVVWDEVDTTKEELDD